tara:strand:- start:2477 stop:3361 length:885 start_codon:yes stop_codon:yes gene_type:complete
LNLSETKRHLTLLFVGILYGANYSVVKTVTPEYIKPFGFIVARVAIATILFWLISLGIKSTVNWKKDGGRIFLCALFGVGINMLAFFKGVSLTSAISGSIIMTLTPAMVFITSTILIKERVTGYKIFGLLIGFIGAALIIYLGKASASQGDWRGDLLVVLNAMSYGTYLVLVKPLLSKYDPITLSKWIFLIGFFLVLPVGWSELSATNWSIFTIQTYYAMAFVIVGVTFLVYLLNIWAMKKVNPSTVGAYIYVQPVFAVLIANLFYDERLTLVHLIAAVLVFLGVGLIVRPFKG